VCLALIVGYLKNLELHVAIKSSKGSTQDVEGKVYQCFSGSTHFLHYFEISNNRLVLELVQIFGKKTTVSSTLDHSLKSCKLTGHYPWKLIAQGVKENNILLHVIPANVTPKIFDFGKATHSTCAIVYEFSDSQRIYYNGHCRHSAFELRNLT